jgi:hypothetical protein
MPPGSAVATFDLRPLEALDALLCRNLYTPQQFLRCRDFDLPESSGPPQTGRPKAMSLSKPTEACRGENPLGTDSTYHTWVGAGNRLDPNLLVEVFCWVFFAVEYDYRFRTNNLGLARDADVAPGLTSLLLLGDSFTEGQWAQPWFRFVSPTIERLVGKRSLPSKQGGSATDRRRPQLHATRTEAVRPRARASAA